MTRRLRKMLGFPLADRRNRPRAFALPRLRPLTSTAAELARSEAAHQARLQNADRVLDDLDRMDGALRLVRR